MTLHFTTYRHRRAISHRYRTLLEMSAFVDLAIVLVCSFAVWNVIHKSYAFEMNLPEQDPFPQVIGCFSASIMLSVIVEQDRVVAWQGLFDGATPLQYANLKNATEWNTILKTHKDKVNAFNPNKNSAFIVVYPSKTASYKNLMDVLDEINVVGIKRYTIGNMQDAAYAKRNVTTNARQNI